MIGFKGKLGVQDRNVTVMGCRYTSCDTSSLCFILVCLTTATVELSSGGPPLCGVC